MNKHAYLILVQNQTELLEYQLPLLDHARVDLYIHIDKKAKKCRPESLKSLVKESKIFFINSTAVSYGSYTQIQCQFELMRQAAKQKYSYYHFLSDCDLPLRTQEHILDFFESHQGREFMEKTFQTVCADVLIISKKHLMPVFVYLDANLKNWNIHGH